MTVPSLNVGDPFTAAAEQAIAAAINSPFLGEATSSSTVTLSTTGTFAGLATVTFTLAAQARVRIDVAARYQPAAAANGWYRIRAGYNTGSSAVVGSFVPVGQVYETNLTSTVTGSGSACGTALLAAGTYTAYGAVARIASGSTTDLASMFYCVAEIIAYV